MPLLEKIYDLPPEQSQVLHSEVADGQLIEVRQYEHYRWLQIGGDSLQGLIDMDSPNQLLFPNMSALMLTLLVCPEPQRLLNLGFGSGSVERFLNANVSDLAITSVEPNPHVVKLAKTFFFIEDDVAVINTSAEVFLSKAESTYDIIFCDIFNNDTHPACLYDEQFYADLHRCLNKEGMVAMNLLPESEEDILDILLQMKHYFSQIALLEVPNHFNAILYASNFPLPETESLEAAAEKLLQQIDIDLRDLPQRLNRLMERVET